MEPHITYFNSQSVVNCMHCFPLTHLPVANDDLFDVKSELEPVAARWKSIGLALRLDPSELKKIEKDNRDSVEDCLTEALTLWLNKAYNTERFGEPSWELLARAVGHPAGGNNPALAEQIAMKYGGITIMKECA